MNVFMFNIFNRISRARCGSAVTGLVLYMFCGFASSTWSQALETRWEVMTAPNPDMTFMLQPNKDFVTLGVPFRTNEFGFRDEPLRPKTPGMFRILVVGDSVTFGTGVKNEETFPNVLEKKLAGRARPSHSVDVINAGISAYNIRNIRGQMQEFMPKIQPSLVVYVFVENDLDDSVSPGPNNYLAAYDPQKPAEEPFVGDDFAGMWMIKRQSMEKQGLFSKLKGLFDNQFEEICQLPPPLILGNHPEPNRRWTRFTQEFETMKALCEGSGARFVVYSFALKNHSEPILKRVEEICQAHQVPEASTLPIFNYSEYADRYSLVYDPHCNPQGHDLMADRLLSFLVESHSLPETIFDLSLPVNHYVEQIDPAVALDLETRSLKGPGEIHFANAQGIIGLLAGFDVYGKIGRSCLFRLGGEGGIMEIQAQSLTDTPEQPVTLSARIEGAMVGPPVQLTRTMATYRFPIPDPYSAQTIEAELITQGPLWVPTIDQRQQGAMPLAAQVNYIKRIKG